MPRKYREYSDDQVVAAAKQVRSIAGLLKKLGLKPAGGNYANMKKTLQRLDVDTSHFTGQGWNKEKQLKDWSQYSRVSSFKPHLIKERGHKCELCKLSEWIEEPIALEVHHIDGDRTHNELSNLQLLCPNCHATTHNWRGRKNKNCSDSDSNRDYSRFKLDDSAVGLPLRKRIRNHS